MISKSGAGGQTVRDIWNRRTWSEATRHLWTAQEQEAKEEAGRGGGVRASEARSPRGRRGQEARPGAIEDTGPGNLENQEKRSKYGMDMSSSNTSTICDRALNSVLCSVGLSSSACTLQSYPMTGSSLDVAPGRSNEDCGRQMPRGDACAGYRGARATSLETAALW
eukprot:766857-Hanusia_phi.AAC.2